VFPTTIEEFAGVTTNEARVRGEGPVPALPHPAMLKHRLITIKNAIARRIWVINRTADAFVFKLPPRDTLSSSASGVFERDLLSLSCWALNAIIASAGTDAEKKAIKRRYVTANFGTDRCIFPEKERFPLSATSWLE